MKNVCQYAFCGKTFESPRTKKFCSVQCSNWDYAGTEVYGKTCIVCASDFQTTRSQKTTCSPECKKNRDRITHVLRRYGLSEEAYAELSKDGCAVCGSFDRLCVDHDHACCSEKSSCGACIRGVLCHSCNSAEGLLNSDPERAIELAAYMVRTSSFNIFSPEAYA